MVIFEIIAEACCSFLFYPAVEAVREGRPQETQRRNEARRKLVARRKRVKAEKITHQSFLLHHLLESDL